MTSKVAINTIEIAKVIRNTGWLFFEKFARLFANLLLTAWIARYLGPTQFGELAYAIAVIAIFQATSILGVENIAVREISKNQNIANEILGTIFRLRFIASIICFWLALITAYLLRSSNLEVVVLISIIALTILFQPSDIVDLWFQSTLQSRKSSIARLTSFAISAALKLLAVHFSLSLIAFASIVTIEAVVTSVLFLKIYQKFPTSKLWIWRTSLARSLLLEGVPFYLSGVVLMGFLHFDRLILGELVSSRLIGIYTISMTITNAVSFIPLAICMSLASSMALIANEHHRLEFFSKLTCSFIWLSAAFITIGYHIASILIPILFGTQYTQSVDVLELHIFSIFFSFISVSNDYFLLNTRKGNVTLMKNCLALAIHVILCIILIPQFGLSGAVASNIISLAISNTIFLWFLLPVLAKIHFNAVMLPLKLLQSKIHTQ